MKKVLMEEEAFQVSSKTNQSSSAYQWERRWGGTSKQQMKMLPLWKSERAC